MNILKHLRDSSKIFLAQTALHLEGIHLDSVDTLDLINSENKKVFEVDEEDAIILRNVVDALDYLKTIDFDNINIDLDLYIKLNSILAKDQALFVGKLRDIPTFIGCIEGEIGVYDKKDIINEVTKLNSINNDNFKKIVPEVFCHLSRMQPFYDGNKRSTNFLCNVALIKKNIGLFFIDYDNLRDFNLNLKDYYQNKNNIILEFIGNKLIRTVNELEKEDSINSNISEVDQKIQKITSQVISQNSYIIENYIERCNEKNNFPYILCLDCSDNSMYVDINIPKKEKIEGVEILDSREDKNDQQKIFSNIRNNVSSFLSRSQEKESKQISTPEKMKEHVFKR